MCLPSGNQHGHEKISCTVNVNFDWTIIIDCTNRGLSLFSFLWLIAGG